VLPLLSTTKKQGLNPSMAKAYFTISLKHGCIPPMGGPENRTQSILPSHQLLTRRKPKYEHPDQLHPPQPQCNRCRALSKYYKPNLKITDSVLHRWAMLLLRKNSQQPYKYTPPNGICPILE
jgi:hypothetical protein